jgi:GNAT superfamily N-acetyltransferase
MTELRMVTADHPAVAQVLDGLAQDYRERYGQPSKDVAKDYDFAPPSGAFFVLVADDAETVAGGALRRLAEGIGEIKRIWTAPAHRGRGYARGVLAALEDAAAGRGYRVLRLRTGARQPEAMELYRSAGYSRIDCHDPEYPNGIWFEKRLRPLG